MSVESPEMVENIKQNRAKKKTQCLEKYKTINLISEESYEELCDLEGELIPETLEAVSVVKKKIKIRDKNAGKETKAD